MPKGVYPRTPTPDRTPDQLADLFWQKVDRTGPCWVWLANTNDKGYGTFWIGPPRRGHVKAHRFAYETEIGPVPAGFELDHLCRNRACVRPSHLEPVSHRENCVRGAQMRRVS